MESFNAARYAAAGIPGPWVQGNYSRSAERVIRGLHYQFGHPQGKLVRVVLGSVRVLDVAVRHQAGLAHVRPVFRG